MNGVRGFRADMVQRLRAFIAERYRIHRLRTGGYPKPWTADPILQRYKFCNVYREDDRVTQWVERHVRRPYAQHPHLWFMLCLARQVNWPDTLAEVIAAEATSAWPRVAKLAGQQWSPAALRTVLLGRGARGEKVYTGAYMLNCVWPRAYEGPREKAYFTTEVVLAPLWYNRKRVSKQLEGCSLQHAHATLSGYTGWGDFLIGQVIADLKHTRYLRKARDWYDWAVLGPGSTRGLRRVQGLPVPGAAYAQGVAVELLLELREELKLKAALPRKLCLQDLQNCLCEFDKYERVRLGEGRPRALYPGI